MRDMDYYPEGAYLDRRAPYNEVDELPEEVEVVVTVTLKKRVAILLDRYDEHEWEDGHCMAGIAHFDLLVKM